MTESLTETRDPRPQTRSAVRVRGVKKSFGRGRAIVHALRGIDMDVAENQLIMLVGPSGCGKTTLVSIISGVLDADTGSVEVFGVDWTKLRPSEKTARRGELVGFVFQQFNLIPALSVLDNTAVPLLVRGEDRKVAEERAVAVLKDVGLADRLNATPAELSGGMQQRVAIARALVGRPRLLICDEPTASLDGQTGQHIMELVRVASRPRDAGDPPRVVICVTHDARIFHYADRIEEMEDGRLKAEPSDIIKQEAHFIPHYDEGASEADQAEPLRPAAPPGKTPS
jgi:putative ABC transport system ATP-binding protein